MQTYSVIGHVEWPLHDPEWVDQKSGVMTVRLIVEDVSVAGDAPPPLSLGGEPFTEDFMVGVEGFSAPKDAHHYFTEPGHLFVENVLVGSVNWSGARETSNGLEYWCASKDALDPIARGMFDKLQTETSYKVWVVTALNTTTKNVDNTIKEAASLGLEMHPVPKFPQKAIRCMSCTVMGRATELPNQPRRKGWQKISGVWLCPEHCGNAQ